MSAEEFARIEYPADAEHAAMLREDLRAWLRVAGVADEIAHGLLLAVGEAVENAIVHAYHTGPQTTPTPNVELTRCLDTAEVVITIADHGTWIDPDTTALEHDTPDGPARHGRGIILMNNHVDNVAIHHDRHGTTVLLRAALPPTITP